MLIAEFSQKTYTYRGDLFLDKGQDYSLGKLFESWTQNFFLNHTKKSRSNDIKLLEIILVSC